MEGAVAARKIEALASLFLASEVPDPEELPGLALSSQKNRNSVTEFRFFWLRRSKAR